MLPNLLRLGYYKVGDKIVLNKANALLEASTTKQSVTWIFNDDVYSVCNWQQPIDTPLSELYRRRAQQLRDQYDYLILYYSGGGDSTNVLYSFVNNNIMLDEIVMQYPKPVEKLWNDQDFGNNNYFSELKYAAIPHLERIKPLLHPNTKIKFLDQCADTINLFNDEYWFEKYPLGTMITPAGAGRQISAIKDPDLDSLYEAGKTVCQIYGVDKPMISIVDNEYYAYFVDSGATHAIPTGFDLGEIASKHFFLEFFYWTPDMPEIVIKQAQEIKKAAESAPAIQKCLSYTAPTEMYRALVHPVIYLEEANVPVFQTVKPSSGVYRPMDQWFWQPEYEQAQQNYLNVIGYLKDNIDPEYFANNNVYNGVKGLYSKQYKI